jgi:hypothetical protein
MAWVRWGRERERERERETDNAKMKLTDTGASHLLFLL